MKRFSLLIGALITLLVGCSPSSLEDFHCEGAAWCRALCKDLSRIESREELAKIEPHLKKRFEDLVALMVEARQFQMKNREECLIDFAQMDHPDALALKDELIRIYSIEGGREVIERTQREAMIKLDAFMKKTKAN